MNYGVMALEREISIMSANNAKFEAPVAKSANLEMDINGSSLAIAIPT